ncbi:MAG TPA: hypothetical protein GXX38_02040 [Clostridia bacterium]|nr:hypothetical protein [Clostridia bacterium]
MSSNLIIPSAEELRRNLIRLRELILKSAETRISDFLPDDPEMFKDPEKIAEFIEEKDGEKLEDWEEEKLDLLYKVSPFVPVALPEEVIQHIIELDSQVKTPEDERKLEEEIRFQHVQTIVKRILAMETEEEWEEFMEAVEKVRQEDEKTPPVFD